MLSPTLIHSTAIGPSSRSFYVSPGATWAVRGPPRGTTPQRPGCHQPCTAQAGRGLGEAKHNMAGERLENRGENVWMGLTQISANLIQYYTYVYIYKLLLMLINYWN